MDEFRRLIRRPDLPDEQVVEARDLLTALADLLVADYLVKREQDVPKQV